MSEAVNNDPSGFVLRDDRIIATVATLRRRIQDRFPGSGLSLLCGDLLDVAQRAAKRAESIGRPIAGLRIAGYVTAVILITLAMGLIGFALQKVEAEQKGVLDWVQAIDAGVNEIILLALSIFFLVGLETRIRRRRALKAIHELRSIAHIIDMHQLTKNPERYVGDWTSTANSPQRKMTPFELNRYLDYCSEMLSLTGKIAALYVQNFDDADAVAAVSEVEQLTTGLSRKIWQKIMILEQGRAVDDRATVAQPPPPSS